MNPLTAECEICGKNRTYSWNQAAYIDTQVDVQTVTEDPLTGFIKWLLYNFLDKPFENVALSHFGVSIYIKIKCINSL